MADYEGMIRGAILTDVHEANQQRAHLAHFRLSCTATARPREAGCDFISSLSRQEIEVLYGFPNGNLVGAASAFAASSSLRRCVS
jgi:hypothetical protein